MRTRPGPSRLALAALLLAAVALLSSCTGRQKEPSSYTDSSGKEFIAACTTQAKDDGVSNANDVCSCAWKTIKKDVPFDDFKKTQDSLAEDPGPLPQRYVDIIDGCKTSG